MPIGIAKSAKFGRSQVAGGTQTFNASGTFTSPAGVLKVNLTGKGAAGNTGATGNGGNTGNAGGTGNSGGYGPGGTGGTGGYCGRVGGDGMPAGGAGSSGGAGSAGSSGNTGAAGNTGSSSTAISQTFPGGTGGNGGAGGAGGSAGNGGAGGPQGSSGNPGNAGNTVNSTGTGGGNEGSPHGGKKACGFCGTGQGAWISCAHGPTPGSHGYALGWGGNGGGASRTEPFKAGPGSGATGGPGGSRQYNGPPFGAHAACNAAHDPGTKGQNAAVHGNQFGIPALGGGGGGGGGASSQNRNGPVGGGGGGGGYGSLGNAGSGGNPGAGGGAGSAGNPGSAANNTAFNCVAVNSGGSYPICVASGGQVVISWDPQ